MKTDKDYAIVEEALAKDGWLITNSPLFIRYEKVNYYIDMAAEKVITAQKGIEKIAIEIKSFIGKSFVSEFQKALGQMLLYKDILQEEDPYRTLYLAITNNNYKRLINYMILMYQVKKHNLKVIVIDENQKEIVQWIN